MDTGNKGKTIGQGQWMIPVTDLNLLTTRLTSETSLPLFPSQLTHFLLLEHFLLLVVNINRNTFKFIMNNA